MAQLFSNKLKLYRNFKALEGSDHEAIVRYYERFESEIGDLDFEECFDCMVTYTEALFETGSFRKHIVMADHLLETIIMKNIQTYQGQDVYTRILFKKAASLYNLERFEQSEHILRELVRINPWEQLYLHFLHTCLLKRKPDWLLRARNISLAFFLLTAGVILFEWLFLRHTWPEWRPPFQKIRIITFVLGILVGPGAEVLHFGRQYLEVRRFSRRIRHSKISGLGPKN